MTRKWASMDAQARRNRRLDGKAEMNLRRLLNAWARIDVELTLPKRKPWYRRMTGRRY
jgi:hypothetical protein